MESDIFFTSNLLHLTIRASLAPSLKLFFSQGSKGPHVPAEGFVGTPYETIFLPGPKGLEEIARYGAFLLVRKKKSSIICDNCEGKTSQFTFLVILPDSPRVCRDDELGIGLCPALLQGGLAHPHCTAVPE